MKLKLLFSALVIAGLSAHADEYKRHSDPEVFDRTFEAMHYVERAYEIGKSTINLSVGCQETSEAAEQAITEKISKIQTLVTEAGRSLKLGETGELYGYNFDNKVETYAANPIQQPSEYNKWQWVNTCTDQTSDKPLRAKNVYVGAKVIEIWFPNQGEVLNHLSALVTEIETLNDKSASGVHIDCQSASGTNYDLTVTKSTEKGAWEEIEAEAKVRARAKVASEFAAVQYDNSWKGKEYFVPNQTTQLPTPDDVKKEGNRWVAKFSRGNQYTVYVKQSADTENSKAADLADTRTYNVQAATSTSQGLYGELSILIQRSCMANKKEAEASVADVGNVILSQLRRINDGAATESDRLDVKDATGTEVSPWKLYRSNYTRQSNANETYFYNECTLDTVQGKQPDGTVWRGTMFLKIKSSKLDDLTALRNQLNEKYKLDIEDPAQVKVTTTWSATAVLSVLEQLSGKLDSEAAMRFLDDKGEFRCEASRFGFACLSSPRTTSRQSGFEKGRVLADEAPGAAPAYTESVTSDIGASERGVMTFKGKYVIQYTLRKVLVDNRRSAQPLP